MKDNIEIIKHFDSPEKPLCFFGVLKSSAGQEIEKEMLPWLKSNYDVIEITQDIPGRKFEYPALSYMQKYCLEHNIKYCLYIHTKGAYNTNEIQSHIRYLWEYEFTKRKDIYINLINSSEPRVICPFTGKSKTTWYNGFFINNAALSIMNPIKESTNRFYYETLFKNENKIQVIGTIYNDVDDEGTNKNTASKTRAKKYVEDLYRNLGNSLLNLSSTIVAIYPGIKRTHKIEYEKLKNVRTITGLKTLDYRKSNLKMYSTYAGNQHHFTTDTHYKILIPSICKELNIDFNIDDFEYVKNIVISNNIKYDLSYYKPNKKYEFSIDIDRDGFYEGDFNILLGFNKSYKNEYHKLFASSHRSCVITNNTIDSDRCLLISGDSHCVPQIPILACYFKKIIYLDNRDEREMNETTVIPNSIKWKDIPITDVFFSLYEDNSIEKYTCDNFSNMNTDIVIYTCITKGYDTLIIPQYRNYKFVCFTDDMTINSNGWTLYKIPESLNSLTPVKQQRYIKTHPHEFFKEYKYSIWVDANIQLLKDPKIFVSPKYSIEIPAHPIRKCIYAEGKECIRLKKDIPLKVNTQLNRYKKEGFPKNYGLPQSNIIIRKHNDPNCIKLMEDWWKEIEQGSHRDQLSFSYVSWKNPNIEIYYLDKKLCNSKYFHWNVKHGKVRPLFITSRTTFGTMPDRIEISRPHTIKVESSWNPVSRTPEKVHISNINPESKNKNNKEVHIKRLFY